MEGHDTEPAASSRWRSVLYVAGAFEFLAGVLVPVTVGLVSDQPRDLGTFELPLAGYSIVVGLFTLFLADAIGQGQEWARMAFVAHQLVSLLGYCEPC